MEEKRNTKRFQEEIEGSVSFHATKEPDMPQPVSIKVIDISLHGAKIATDQYIPVFTNFKITLNLRRSNQVVTMDARVAWVKKNKDVESYEMGVEFYHNMKTIENLQKHLYGN